MSIKPTARVGSESAADVATLALFLIGGKSAPVDTEDIAIKAFEIAPEKFSWRKYRERIDLEATRVALRHASEVSSGGLVTGGAATGWMLTPAGIELAGRLDVNKDHKVQPRRGSADARLAAERERARSTIAWTKFCAGNADGLTIHDFRALLRVNEYFPAAKIRERLAMLENAAAEDQDLSNLIVILKEQFLEGALHNE